MFIHRGMSSIGSRYVYRGMQRATMRRNDARRHQRECVSLNRNTVKTASRRNHPQGYEADIHVNRM